MHSKNFSHFYKIKSPIKKKILLLLFGGISLGLAYSPGKQIKVLMQMANEWQKIDKRNLIRNLHDLYNYGFIDWKEKSDGSCEVVITKKGRSRARLFDIDNMVIEKPDHWDKKWRIVFFDIPEKKRQARDALREKLKDLGFYKVQKSVFIFPYECEDEINFIINLFGIGQHVCYMEAVRMTNEVALRRFFKIV